MNKTSTFATWRQAAMNCRFASRFIIISSIFLINNMPTYIYLCALSVWSCFVWLFATVPSWIQLFGDCLLRDGMTGWLLRVWLHWNCVCSSHHFGKGSHTQTSTRAVVSHFSEKKSRVEVELRIQLRRGKSWIVKTAQYTGFLNQQPGSFGSQVSLINTFSRLALCWSWCLLVKYKTSVDIDL